MTAAPAPTPLPAAPDAMLAAPPFKKLKLAEFDHSVDDLFKNKNKHTLSSSMLSSKLRYSSTKLGKSVKRILIQFMSRDEQKTGSAIDVPIGFTPDKLQLLVNTLLTQSENPLPYAFYYNHSLSKKTTQASNHNNNNNNKTNEEAQESNQNNEHENGNENETNNSATNTTADNKLITNVEINTSLRRFIEHHNRFYFGKSDAGTGADVMQISAENVLTIIYEPQAVFKVQAISRCSANLPGHTEAILSVSFNPSCEQIASGSGDSTIRLWKTASQMPSNVLKGHSHWVLTVEYSPNGRLLASADMSGKLFLWNCKTGYKLSKYPLNAHSKFITSIVWQPFHLNAGKCEFIATSSKDKLLKIWNTRTRKILFCFSGHTDVVTKIKWGGERNAGVLYSASRDRTIRVWSADDGTCIRILTGHSHWINHISLNTENVLKTGCFNEHGVLTGDTIAEQVANALQRYQTCKDCRGELLCSASDDFTLYLWNPLVTDKPVARMTGHQQLVNHVSFSNDGRLIASASFDKSVRIWDGLTGAFIARLLGHVQAVYRVCWSSDNRMLASASQDSTVKIWNLSTKKLVIDLPGHADEVYAVDWSTNGLYLCSGGKDRMLRIWTP